MNLQQILPKVKAYPLALSLFGVAILLAGWAYWRSGGALEDAQTQLAEVTASHDVAEKNVTAGGNIDEQLAQLTAANAKYKAALINPAEVVPNQEYFRKVAKDAGVAVVDPTQGVTAERGKDLAEPSLTTFTLSASGSWSDMVSFLYGLQTGPHLLRFNQFHLEKTKQMAGTGPGAGAEQLILTLNVEVLGQ